MSKRNLASLLLYFYFHVRVCVNICTMSLPRGAVGWPMICDYDISWPQGNKTRVNSQTQNETQ